jgi:hypothetical protein
LLTLILSAAAVLAEAAQPAPAVPTPPPKPKTEIRLPASQVAGVVPQGADDEIICRKEQLVGSRMFKTYCEQKSIAEERRNLDQDAVRHIQEMSMSGGH